MATDALIAVFSFSTIAFVAFIVLCCFKQKQLSSSDITPQQTELEEGNSTLSTNLIPPLFFTQGVKDPLQQDDLMERITPQ